MAARGTAVTQPHTLLQIAAAVQVAITYNGVLTNELQLWGYPVASRARNGSGSRAEEPVVIEV